MSQDDIYEASSSGKPGRRHRPDDTGGCRQYCRGPGGRAGAGRGGVKVTDQEQVVGAALDEGDLVSVAEGGTAVIEYRDGCRYTVTGGGSGVEYIVDHAQCICYESLDLSKHSRHDAVAELGRIDGKAMVAAETPYTDGVEGTELKEGHRVMTLEDSSARVEYYFGCDYTLGEGETYTVDAEVCCLALGLPEEPLEEPPVPVRLSFPSSATVPALAVVTGIVAVVPEDDEDPPPSPISP